MLDWVYPPNCAGCGVKGYRWCPACHANGPHVSGPVCPICGEPGRNGKTCHHCRQHPPAFTTARAWALHDGSARHALHQLKYRRDIGLGDALSQEMILLLDELDWQPQIVVPVPLGKNRQQERGYNQAALLARPVSLALGLPYKPQVLQRKRETRTQVGLTRDERRQNMRGAFTARRQSVEGRHVLLVDDVMTTGATLNSAAIALKEAGAANIWAITFARAA